MKLTGAQLQRLGVFLTERLGLAQQLGRTSEMERAFSAAATEFGFTSAEACLEWLHQAPLTRNQIETLASHFTIGETYFFRESEVFGVLEKQILPEIIEARRKAGERRLRIWSAGCSSGEEAYTLAIVLHQLLPDIASWHITVLGTDINPKALATADRGVYGAWSFRGVAPSILRRYFQPAEERFQKVIPEIRSLVQFSYLNLAESNYPSLVTNTTAVDLIFCRNVLLYFSKESAASVTDRFYRALMDGGWLIGGSAEHFQAPGYLPVAIGGRRFFRKSPVNPVRPPAPATFTLPVRPHPPKPDRASGRPAARQPEASARSAMVQNEQGAKSSENLADLARSAANGGDLESALIFADASIELEKLDPRRHYLRGTILTEMSELAAAESAFQRALFLDPNFVLAHFALATLARRKGKDRETRKHIQNASAALSASDPEELLPGSDGITVARFADFIDRFQVQLS